MLESRNQSLPSLLSRFAHACEQHGVCLVLHLVEGTILQVLWYARDIIALPFVNSGEQAAELPDLIREGGKKGERKWELLVKIEEDLKDLPMLLVGVHYSSGQAGSEHLLVQGWHKKWKWGWYCYVPCTCWFCSFSHHLPFLIGKYSTVFGVNLVQGMRKSRSPAHHTSTENSITDTVWSKVFIKQSGYSMLVRYRSHRIMELFWLEKTFKIIKSSS